MGGIFEFFERIYSAPLTALSDALDGLPPLLFAVITIPIGIVWTMFFFGVVIVMPYTWIRGMWRAAVANEVSRQLRQRDEPPR